MSCWVLREVPQPARMVYEAGPTGYGLARRGFGGGSDEEWQGHLTAHHPLAPDTAWIEIDGQRIELTGKALQCEVSIETLPEANVAHRHLWRRLAVPNHFHESPEIEASIDALIAVGALEPDDPVLSELRAVREAMPDYAGRHAGGPRGVRCLPEPWRSLLSRGRQDGPEGTLALSAVTPGADGCASIVG